MRLSAEGLPSSEQELESLSLDGEERMTPPPL